jgi:hypothetical protein
VAIVSTTVNLLQWALIGLSHRQPTPLVSRARCSIKCSRRTTKTRRKRVQTRALAAFGAAFFKAPDSVDASRYCEILNGTRMSTRRSSVNLSSPCPLERHANGTVRLPE